MKGFVPTPSAVVDLMVEKLFAERTPTPHSRILDPGCGRGAFVDGIMRWCDKNEITLPQIVGIESDPSHVEHLRARFSGLGNFEIRHADYLQASTEEFDFIIGNPPYVSITSLAVEERETYRSRYQTARGRFDLYLLFFEQSLRSITRNGRLVFITPEKFLYVESASPFRELLRRYTVEELHFVDEETFAGLVTYPLITTVTTKSTTRPTSIVDREGSVRSISQFGASTSWMPLLRNADKVPEGPCLEDACLRISCGVATGADSAFLLNHDALTPGLRPFAHPTLAGRDITSVKLPSSHRSLLVPYDRWGRLLPESELGELGEFLSQPERKKQLNTRTCVSYKPWYAFHETPPLNHILRPKILCKDIGGKPVFVVDSAGSLVPRHSIYYIVPTSLEGITELAEYLNSAAAANWLWDNCQRAAKGFLRLQSHVLKRLPLPQSLDWLVTQKELTAAGVE